MDELTHEVKLIPTLVEKITKGVRRQLRGYVQQTQERIECSKRSIDSRITEFERLVKITRDMQKDWYAVELMLRENESNKKLIYEIKVLYGEVRNELMDMKLLNVDLQQKLKGLDK